MDYNKLAAGIFLALIVVIGGNIVSEGIFTPDHLDKPAYHVDLGDTGNETQTAKSDAPAYLIGDAFMAMVASADHTKGEKIFKKCVACHSNEAGAAHKVGPNLWNVFDQDIAAKAGYSYSNALAALEGNWTVEALNGWLYNPRKYAKGNRMGFAGLKNDAQRADMIAYLKTLK